MDVTNQMRSIGRICNEIQLPVTKALTIAEIEGIRPCITLDGVRYYSQRDAERLAEAVYARREESGNAI